MGPPGGPGPGVLPPPYTPLDALLVYTCAAEIVLKRSGVAKGF